MLVNSKLKTFVMSSGERYCLLVDSHSNLPLFYPNLYVTTPVRNRSLSYSAMEATLSSISVLIKFPDKQIPITIQEFNLMEKGAVHITEFGICVHDFTMTPLKTKIWNRLGNSN